MADMVGALRGRMHYFESISSILAYDVLTECNLREKKLQCASHAAIFYCTLELHVVMRTGKALQVRNIDAAPVIITLMIGFVIVSADARAHLILDERYLEMDVPLEIVIDLADADEENMDSPSIEPNLTSSFSLMIDESSTPL